MCVCAIYPSPPPQRRRQAPLPELSTGLTLTWVVHPSWGEGVRVRWVAPSRRSSRGGAGGTRAGWHGWGWHGGGHARRHRSGGRHRRGEGSWGWETWREKQQELGVKCKTKKKVIPGCWEGGETPSTPGERKPADRAEAFCSPGDSMGRAASGRGERLRGSRSPLGWKNL